MVCSNISALKSLTGNCGARLDPKDKRLSSGEDTAVATSEIYTIRIDLFNRLGLVASACTLFPFPHLIDEISKDV